MDDTGLFLFSGNLDPRAQEFFPVNPYTYPLPSVQLYNFYCPYPPPPPTPLQIGDVLGYSHQVQPFPAPCLPPQSPIPTRTLLVSMVSPDVSESLVRVELEVFGDVRAVQMERIRDGIATVHFYDLRHAQSAAAEIQEQHMQQQDRLRRHYESGAAAALPPPLPSPARGLIAGRAVWAQFITPATCSIPEGNNQGTLVLHNVDPNVSSRLLKDIFRSFGDVKEVRETPTKRHQKFVEFYDVREAANAFVEMNQKEINGKQILIEYSRPGGNINRRLPRPKSRATTAVTPAFPTTATAPPRFQENKKSWRKYSKSGPPPPAAASSSKQRGKSGKKWKLWNVGGKDCDPRFVINEEEAVEESAVAGGGESRTTVMIKNIPNKYSQKLLLNMLDNHCIQFNEQISTVDGGDDDGTTLHHHPNSSYDFVYLPIDFINKCNVGYGFVNMTSPEAARRLYKAFHFQTWEAFNSRKICQVTYARIQGIEALKEHFKNSRFPCEAEDYMPVVFSPPRDGRTLTVPVPIFGCGEHSPLLICPSPVSSKEDCDDDDSLNEGLQSLALDEQAGYGGPESSSNDEGEAAAVYGGGDDGDFDGQ